MSIEPRGTGDRSDLRVVLVEPRYAANVGSVARVCANFGVTDLVITGDLELTDPARIMSVHAEALLDEAERVPDLAAGLSPADSVVGFTAITSEDANDHLRDGLTLPQLADRLPRMDQRTALVFGREDYGLFNDELAACDIVCEIPVHPEYTSMNLSHAVAVVLYEVVGRQRPPPPAPKAATNEEIERMLRHAEALARRCRFRDHKILPTLLALRRVVGRAQLSSLEYHRLMGLLSKALKELEAWPVPDERWSSTTDLLTRATGPEDPRA